MRISDWSSDVCSSDLYQRRIDDLPKPKGGARQRGLFKGGYQAVDASFLAELEEHRTALAKAFKKADHTLDSETLTEIVQRTLDRLESPVEVAKLRFADIACGSGSFLLGVFDELLRYHAEWYNRPENDKRAKRDGCVRNEDKLRSEEHTSELPSQMRNPYAVYLLKK